MKKSTCRKNTRAKRLLLCCSEAIFSVLAAKGSLFRSKEERASERAIHSNYLSINHVSIRSTFLLLRGKEKSRPGTQRRKKDFFSRAKNIFSRKKKLSVFHDRRWEEKKKTFFRPAKIAGLNHHLSALYFILCPRKGLRKKSKKTSKWVESILRWEKGSALAASGAICSLSN